MVIPPKFERADDFSDGRAVVQYKGNSCYIDKKGDIKIEGPFYQANRFNGGMADVVYEGGGEAYVDKNGKIIYEWK